MKFIDNIIERAYFKRFPERLLISHEAIAPVVITRTKPVAIRSTFFISKRAYEQIMPIEEVKRKLAQAMASELAKFIRIDSVEPINEQVGDIVGIKGTIEILSKEDKET